jgi:hypothetical protein
VSTVVIAYVPDLMDQSRIRAAHPGVRFVRRAADLLEVGADHVIVDLDRPDSASVLDRLSGTVVGFAAHVDTERLDAARAAGISEALPRSVFFARLARSAPRSQR